MAGGPITKDTSTIALGLAQVRIGKSWDLIAQATPALAAADSIGSLASTKFSSQVTYFKHESGFPASEDMSIPLKEVCQLEAEWEELTPMNMAMTRGLDAKPYATKVIVGSGTLDLTKITYGPAAVKGKSYVLTFSSATAFTVTCTGVTFDSNAGTTAAGIQLKVGGVLVLGIPSTAFGGTWATTNTATLTITGYPQAHSGTIGLGNLANPADIRMEAVYTYPNGTNTMTLIFPRAQVESSPDLNFQKDKPLGVTVKFVSKEASSNNVAGNAVWDSMPQGCFIFA